MDYTDRKRGLTASVLVLNRLYMAVHVVGVRRAFCLLYRELAEVIHMENGQFANYDFESWQLSSEISANDKTTEQDWIRAVAFELQVPRIIRLLRYDRVPRYSLRFSRRNLFARDNHSCQYCGKSAPASQLSLDHVMPRSRGGPTTWENVVCCCVECNTRKGGRTPKEARMRLLSKPAKPRFNPLLARKLNNPKYRTWHTFVKTPRAAVDVA
jgi:5-methylcytosine-specific restriction endonuclease McrA